MVQLGRTANPTQLKLMEKSVASALDEIKQTKKTQKSGAGDISILADDEHQTLRRDVKQLKQINDQLKKEIEQLQGSANLSRFEDISAIEKSVGLSLLSLRSPSP